MADTVNGYVVDKSVIPRPKLPRTEGDFFVLREDSTVGMEPFLESRSLR